jgi:hypothetical protein
MRRVRLLKECRDRVVDDFRERENQLKDLSEGLKVRIKEIELKQREMERKKRSIEKDIELQVEDVKKLVEGIFKEEIKESDHENPNFLNIFEDEKEIIKSKQKMLKKVVDENSDENETQRFLKYIESNCYSNIGWSKNESEIEEFLGKRNTKASLSEIINEYLEKKSQQKSQIELNILTKLIEKLTKRKETLTRNISPQKVEEKYKKNYYINLKYLYKRKQVSKQRESFGIFIRKQIWPVNKQQSGQPLNGEGQKHLNFAKK